MFETFKTSYEILEDPKKSAPEYIFQRTVAPEKAPNKASFVTIGFKKGDPVSVNNKKLKPLAAYPEIARFSSVAHPTIQTSQPK